MPFRFPYERILNIKGLDKTLGQLVLQQTRENGRMETSCLEEIVKRQEQLEQSMLELTGEQTWPASYLSEWHQYHDHLDKEIQLQRSKAEAAAERVRQSQEHLLQKTVEENTWRKIKEHFIGDYQKQQSRRQQQETDDLVNRRHFTREG